MSKYRSKLGQNATYLRVYKGDRMLQSEEVIDVIKRSEEHIAKLQELLIEVYMNELGLDKEEAEKIVKD